MIFTIDDRVYVKSRSVLGTVSAIFEGRTRDELYHIKSAESHCPHYFVWYEVEYDHPVWNGDFTHGYVATVMRGYHTSDVLQRATEDSAPQ